MIVADTDLTPIVIEYIVDLCATFPKINQSITLTISCMEVCKQWREAFLKRLPTMEDYPITATSIQIFQHHHGDYVCIFHRTTIVKAIIDACVELTIMDERGRQSSLKSLLKMGYKCLISRWCLSYHLENRYPVFDKREILDQYYKIAIYDLPATCPHDDPITTDWYCIECIESRYDTRKTSQLYVEYTEDIDLLPTTDNMYIFSNPCNNNGFNVLTINYAWINTVLSPDYDHYIMDVVTLTEQELECCRHNQSH